MCMRVNSGHFGQRRYDSRTETAVPCRSGAVACTEFVRTKDLQPLPASRAHSIRVFSSLLFLFSLSLLLFFSQHIDV